MKILLIHKFHYMLGGTETFHYNLAEALTAAGHEVIFFSMYDKRNIPCAQDKYFVSNVDYNDPNLSTFKKIKMGIKLIYSFESKHNIEKLIRDEKPDIAHIGLLHRQITFSVVDVLKKYNIPVVMHLHELTAVCPCYTMLRQDGTICSDCATKGYWNCVKNKCMKGSLAKSVLAYTEAQFLRYGHYYDKIDLYIAECNFYKNLVEKAHFTHKAFSFHNIDRCKLKEMIRYSIVLIPNTFMWWIMNSSDRVMVTYMIGAAANGIYAVSYKLPTLVLISVLDHY